MNTTSLKEAKDLLNEARDLLVMCQLIDKSGQCTDMVDKIDFYFEVEQDRNRLTEKDKIETN